MVQYVAIAAFYLALVTSLTAQDTLPPVRQLLSETLARCNADRDENRAALNDLAVAQCYLREFDAARRTLTPYQADDIFQQAFHLRCARIEIQLTGSTENIPAALWKDGFGFMHCEAAKAFVERGEIDKAFQHLNAVPKSLPSALTTFGFELVQKLQDAQQPEQCRRLLLLWAACYDDSKSVFDYRDGHRFPKLVQWLVELQERPRAKALCERLRSIVEVETDIDECGGFIGLAWAEYALALNALEERDVAREALGQARQWMDKALNAKFDPTQPITSFDFARCYAAIAARQAVVLGDEGAADAYQQAYQLAALAVNPRYGEYAYEKVVDEQLKGGDESGARQTIRRMLKPTSIAKSWQRICEHDLTNRNEDSARAAARAAVQALDHDGFEPSTADEMARVAATAALAGETLLAQGLFKRALALLMTDAEPHSQVWMAEMQIRGGLLKDAFHSIQSIPEPADRLGPLAKLCLALAQAEYAAQRTKR